MSTIIALLSVVCRGVYVLCHDLGKRNKKEKKTKQKREQIKPNEQRRSGKIRS
jgi:hypothetical protein